MNEKQRLALVAGMIVAVLVGIVPPWNYTWVSPEAGGFPVEKPAGYRFLFSPPPPELDLVGMGVRVDIDRLLISWLIVGTLTSVAVLLLKRPRMHPFRAWDAESTSRGSIIKCSSCGISNTFPSGQKSDARFFCINCFTQLWIEPHWKRILNTMKDHFSGGQRRTVYTERKASLYLETNTVFGRAYVLNGTVANKSGEVLRSIRVIGSLHGVEGEVLGHARCYAGNPLSREEVKTLPLNHLREKIETCGDILVDTGSKLPFTLVFHNLQTEHPPSPATSM